MNINKIYKRGQGKNTRLGTGLALMVIVLLGGVVLYNHLDGRGPAIQVLIPSGICLLLGFLIFWLLNKPSVADFLIAAEGEIKKVSWSTRKEIVASTTVVISVVVIMSAGLAVVDLLFNWFFSSIVGLY